MLTRRLAFVLSFALIAMVAVPLVVDRPFATQTPARLALVHALRQWLPAIAPVAAAAAIAIAIVAWRRSRGRLIKATLVVAMAASAVAAWVARQNVFEWMFRPLPRAAFVSARAATFMEPGDLVLAVRVGDDAAAYPVRQLAYHHVVNDRIGRTPAVVTY